MTPHQFKIFKNSYNKKKYQNNNIYEKLENIKLHGTNLLKYKLDYFDIKNKDLENNFRIFITTYSLRLI